MTINYGYCSSYCKQVIFPALVKFLLFLGTGGHVPSGPSAEYATARQQKLPQLAAVRAASNMTARYVDLAKTHRFAPVATETAGSWNDRYQVVPREPPVRG